jgi:hypothetical protein
MLLAISYNSQGHKARSTATSGLRSTVSFLRERESVAKGQVELCDIAPAPLGCRGVLGQEQGI